MIRIDYSHKNYTELKQSLAAQLKITPVNDVIFFPNHIATGYYKFLSLSNGLECLITNCKLNQDLYVFNKRIQEECYTLRFAKFSVSKNLVLKIDNEYLWDGKQQKDSAILTSSLCDFAFFASRLSEIKSINILISREWLVKYPGLELSADMLKRYLTIKTDRYNFAPLDKEHHGFFDNVMNDKMVKEKNNRTIESSIMWMVERFLSDLNQKLNFFKEREKIKIRYDELKRLMQVESCLVKDFSAPPPSIPYLSRVAAMSSTTLKNKFKKLYGDSLYEYFQKRRMQRANVLILAKKYSIKEIGTLLGYTNLSNFTIAYKKEFNRLPSKTSLHI